MRIIIAGGHGKIALLLSSLLRSAGHDPVGLIRTETQADDLRAAGAEPVVLDLESSTDDEVVAVLRGADAVVFAAGAGPNSGAARKLTVDRDGAILLARSAHAAGVRRVVILSAIGTDQYDPESDDVMQVYSKAKSEADAAVRALDVDWTIVRPGGLTDEAGTGLVTVGETVGRGYVPRADVAAVIAEVLVDGSTVHRQFELVSGDTPIVEAVSAL